VATSVSFLFTATATTSIYTLSLHDALPIFQVRLMKSQAASERKQILDELWDAEQRAALKPAEARIGPLVAKSRVGITAIARNLRSEEHTSELQSRFDLVCRLLLEKKKKTDT